MARVLVTALKVSFGEWGMEHHLTNPALCPSLDAELGIRPLLDGYSRPSRPFATDVQAVSVSSGVPLVARKAVVVSSSFSSSRPHSSCGWALVKITAPHASTVSELAVRPIQEMSVLQLPMWLNLTGD
jgi:hypothetical protein